jgi:hypothetical protein
VGVQVAALVFCSEAEVLHITAMLCSVYKERNTRVGVALLACVFIPILCFIGWTGHEEWHLRNIYFDLHADGELERRPGTDASTGFFDQNSTCGGCDGPGHLLE